MKGDGSQLLLEVRNQGLAIEPSELKGIFDPLRRSAARGKNTDAGNSLGLGLYIARQIVEKHGGDISADSNQTATVFTVRLPAQPGEATTHA